MRERVINHQPEVMAKLMERTHDNTLSPRDASQLNIGTIFFRDSDDGPEGYAYYESPRIYLNLRRDPQRSPFEYLDAPTLGILDFSSVYTDEEGNTRLSDAQDHWIYTLALEERDEPGDFVMAVSVGDHHIGFFSEEHNGKRVNGIRLANGNVLYVNNPECMKVYVTSKTLSEGGLSIHTIFPDAPSPERPRLLE